MQHAPPLVAATARRPAAGWSVAPVALVLLGALVALALVSRRPAPLRVTVGVPGDEPYVAGVNGPERTPAGDRVFRWTKPVTQLRAPGTAFEPHVLSLRAHGDLEPAVARPVAVSRGDRPLAGLLLDPTWRDYHLLLPAAAGLEAWDDPPVVLAVDPLPRAPDDGRDRGFPLAQVMFAPLERAIIPWPVLPAVALLAIGAAWLWQLDRASGASAPLRPWRVAVVVGLLALAAALLARDRPYDYARMLPALPWTAGLATLLLAMTLGSGSLHGLHGRYAGPAAGVLLLLGLALLDVPALRWAGGAFTAAGLVLFPRTFTSDASPAWLRIDGRTAALALALIWALAMLLRLYRIQELPYGLWRDEGRHGLEALRMLEDPGYRPAYVPGVDLPGLGLLPFSWALRVWGIEPWSLRTVTAIAGAAAVVPLYGLTSLLTNSRAAGLVAALLLAASHWSIALSRFAFPTIFDPLLQLTALWLLLVGLRSASVRSWRFLALPAAGACLGLAVQTYHTGRIGIVVAGAFMLSYIAAHPGRRRAWPAVLALVAGFVLAAYPLLDYALDDPARFSSRLSAVSLLGEHERDWHGPLGKLDRSLGAHLLMFWATGDQNGRHVAPGRPMLDPIAGLGLLAGLAVVVRGIRDWRKQCLLIGLVVGLLPSALAVEYPHAMRSIDALGFACAIAALGLVTLGRTLAAALRSARRADAGTARRRGSGALIVAAGAAAIVAFNAWVYFVAMPPDPAVWAAVYPYHTQIGAYMQHLADEQGDDALRDVYVPAGLVGNAVFDFLTRDLEVRTYRPDEPTPHAPGARFVVSGALGRPDVERLIRRQRLDPASAVAGPRLPDGSRPAFVVYRAAD